MGMFDLTSNENREYKTANLSEYFLWEGQVTQVTSINTGHKSIGFSVKKKVTCPHCKEQHEIDDYMDVIEASPMFQEGATPIKSLTTTKNS